MGQLGSNLGNSNVTDPSQARPQDLSGGEMGARLLAQGMRGLAGGFSDYEKQNQQLRQGGPAMPVPMPQQPQVQIPMGNQPFTQPQKRGPNNLSFYGGGQ